MAHLAAKKINLEELWPELEAGISTMVTNLNQGFPQKKWIELYTYAAHIAHARPSTLTLSLKPCLQLLHHLAPPGGEPRHR